VRGALTSRRRSLPDPAVKLDSLCNAVQSTVLCLLCAMQTALEGGSQVASQRYH
jgi:hypothetical protein